MKHAPTLLFVQLTEHLVWSFADISGKTWLFLQVSTDSFLNLAKQLETITSLLKVRIIGVFFCDLGVEVFWLRVVE